MAISVTHALQTTVPESTGSGQASGIIGPTEWNAQHVITGTLDTPITATITTSSYTFVGADTNGYIPFSSNSAQTALIPQGVFEVGTQLTVEQSGVGLLSISAATTTVTIHPPPPIIAASQFAVIGLFQRAANVWTAFGRF